MLHATLPERKAEIQTAKTVTHSHFQNIVSKFWCTSLQKIINSSRKCRGFAIHVRSTNLQQALQVLMGVKYCIVLVENDTCQ
jgi:hypothetical protein